MGFHELLERLEDRADGNMENGDGGISPGALGILLPSIGEEYGGRFLNATKRRTGDLDGGVWPG